MGSIPVRSTKKWRMQSCIRHFFVVFHEFDLGSSIRQSRILAEGPPLAGNGKFPSKERLVVIFSKYCSTRKLPFLRQAWTGLYRMPDKNKTNRGLTASFWLIHRYARGLYVKYWSVRLPCLSLKTRRQTCSREEPPFYPASKAPFLRFKANAPL